MTDKLNAEKDKPSKVVNHYLKSQKCTECDISSIKERLYSARYKLIKTNEEMAYLENIANIMLIYIIVINIALIIKNKVFREDIISLFVGCFNIIIASAKGIWCFANGIGNIAYKIENTICGNIFYWVIVVVILGIVIAITLFIVCVILGLLKMAFNKWDTIQSYIFITILTLITYISDMLYIKIFNINLIVIFVFLLVLSAVIRLIYYNRKGK